MKSRLILFGFLFLYLISCIHASDFAAVEDQLNNANKAGETIEKAQDVAYWEEKWDYLAQEWKAILLKSPIISFLNSFFNQISIVFQVLFGVPYSLSLILFFIIIIWVYVMFNIAGLVEAGGLFPGAYSYIAGFLVSIILAQFAVYEKVILFLGNLIFSPANMWVRTLIFAIVVFAFVLIEIGDRKLAEFLKSKRANEAQHKEELNRKFLETEVAEQRVRKK